MRCLNALGKVQNNMGNHLEKELKEIGLSEKEAKVYLASLELGPATAQEIAAKAEVNRPTTYVMIDSLTSQGLMSQFEKGKKRYFAAEAPENFEVLIKKERKVVEEKERKIGQLLGDLRALMKFAAMPPKVRFYEGLEGVNNLREDLINSRTNELFEIIPLDLVRKFVDPKFSTDDLRPKIKRQVKTKTLFSSKKGHTIKEERGRLDVRQISSEKDLPAEVILFGDKTIFMTFSGKPAGFVIESREVTETMKLLFDSFWNTSEK